MDNCFLCLDSNIDFNFFYDLNKIGYSVVFHNGKATICREDDIND